MKITYLPLWKELKASSGMAMGSHIISEGLTTPKALHGAHWQALSFWLCLAQQEASGWWDASPRFCELCHIEFLTHTDVSSTRDFWAMRLEKTLALAWVLQACVKESGFPTGVLCESAHELQKYMAPMMAPNRDEIVEVSLLTPTGEEHRICPTQEEQASLLGKVELPQVPEQLEVHELIHPAEQIAASAACPPSPPSQQSYLPSQKAKKSQQGIKANTASAGQWVCAYLEENDRVPKCWREFWCLLHSKDQCPGDSPIQRLACQQAVAFWLSTAQQKWMAGESPHPVWGYLGGGTTFPQRISTEPGTTRRWEGGNDCPGHGPLEVHGLIGNAPRNTLWSSAGVC